MDERSPKARKDLGHTESMMMKLHPDLMAHLEQSAELSYCSKSEYVRQLIVADMKASQK